MIEQNAADYLDGAVVPPGPLPEEASAPGHLVLPTVRNLGPMAL